MDPTNEDWDRSFYTSLFSIITPTRPKFHPPKGYLLLERALKSAELEFLMGKFEADLGRGLPKPDTSHSTGYPGQVCAGAQATLSSSDPTLNLPCTSLRASLDPGGGGLAPLHLFFWEHHLHLFFWVPAKVGKWFGADFPQEHWAAKREALKIISDAVIISMV